MLRASFGDVADEPLEALPRVGLKFNLVALFPAAHWGKTMTANIITISKLDAARRQLATAITLWFTGGDPVCIHALAYAAYEIMHVISKKRHPSRRDLLFDSAMIPDEVRKDYNIAFKRHANFFKHSDRDADATIPFIPALSESFIVFAIAAFELCEEPLSDEFVIFREWARIQKPYTLSKTEREFLVKNYGIEHLAHFRAMPKDRFFHEVKIRLRTPDT
jgi:hypothetical protein